MIYIATPTLGNGPHFHETIRSVKVGRSYRYTIITPEWALGGMVDRYPHERILAEGARGIYGALNTAILDFLKSDCTHFTFINDDDALCRGFWRTWDLIRSGAISEDVVIGRVAFSDFQSRKLGYVSYCPIGWAQSVLMRGDIIPFTQQGVILSRKAVLVGGQFDVRYRLCADTDFLFRLLSSGVSIRAGMRVHGTYRLQPGQLSSAQGVQAEEMNEIRGKVVLYPKIIRILIKMAFNFINLGPICGRVIRMRSLTVRGYLHRIAL